MQEMLIPIIYEDDDVLAINKPAGLSVHSDGRNTEPTLVDWIISNFPECEHVGEPMKLLDGKIIPRPGIVHRLDKDTSGVLLIAKNQPAFLWLKQAFQNRTINKTYHALTYGNFKETEGVIEAVIGRSKKDPRIRIAHSKAAGKLREAKTRYKVIEQFPDYSYVEAYPETGRTHQIRVHLKSINHSIVCDSLYAEGKNCLPGLARQALHAGALSLLKPNGQALNLEAPLPPDFQSALDYLRTL